MSFDKQNFARTIAEQQAGIAPQMWPIKIDVAGGSPGSPQAVSLNSPFEVEINPCDCIYLPYTYDKSYGPNGIQNDPAWNSSYFDPAIVGQNMFETYSTNSPWLVTIPPIFGLRFNSPNNPWLLWGLGTLQKNNGGALQPSNGEGAEPFYRHGCSTMMRSITGPISRLWCQYYAWGGVRWNNDPSAFAATFQQIILISMLGFRQDSREFWQGVITSSAASMPQPPPEHWSSLSCGGYHTTDLNSADLRVLGQTPFATAPTTSGPGSTKG